MVTEITQVNIDGLNKIISENNPEAKIFAIFSENDNSYIYRIIIGHNNGTMVSNVISELVTILTEQLELPLDKKLKLRDEITEECYKVIQKKIEKYT